LTIAPILIAGLLQAAAQQGAAPQPGDKQDPVQPDRPNTTNSAHIVPLNHPYLELGYRQFRTGNQTIHDYGDGATLRIGVLDNLEARIGIPSYLSVLGDGRATGFSDENLAFKWRLSKEVEAKHPAFAISGFAQIPSGARAFRGPRIQPGITGIGSMTLTDQMELDANITVARPADDMGAYTEFDASASVSRDLGMGFGTFFELGTQLPQVGRVDRNSFVDLGFTKLLCNQVQIDAIVGHGLNGIEKDYFFGAGLSIKF